MTNSAVLSNKYTEKAGVIAPDVNPSSFRLWAVAIPFFASIFIYLPIANSLAYATRPVHIAWLAGNDFGSPEVMY